MAAGRGDALLEHTHLVRQVRLVAHGGGHAAQQRGDLGTGLREAEDVVDEQQHVLVLHIAEVLRHGQRGQGHAQTRARRLVHLAEHEGGVLEDVRLLHLDPEVVALTGALADAGEHGGAAEVAGHTGDHLLDEHGLAHAGAAEQADLAALDVGGQQVDDLDAGLQHLGGALEGREVRGRAVDRPAVLGLQLRGRHVQGLAEHVEDVALHGVADRHRDGGTGVHDVGAAHQAVGGLQGDGADHVVAEVLGDLEGDRAALAVEVDLGGQRVVDLRHRVGRELGVDHGADDAGHASGGTAGGGPGALVSDGGSHLSHFYRVWMASLVSPERAQELLSASAPAMSSVSSWVISA